MWPLATLSTTTMSKWRSRTSQQSLPTLAISRTPGAAEATSRTSWPVAQRTPPSRTSGAKIGIGAATPQCPWTSPRGSAPLHVLQTWSPVSKLEARSPLASISHSSVRLPLLAARTPSAAAIVVLPTPPLPVQKRAFGRGPQPLVKQTPARLRRLRSMGLRQAGKQARPPSGLGPPGRGRSLVWPPGG